MIDLPVRKVSAAVAVAALATVTAACGSSGPQSGAGGGADGGGGAATAWALTGGDEATFRASEQQWNAENPDAQITYTFFANDAYKQKVRTAVGAGEAPTLIYGWGGGILKSYVDAGQVQDLTADVKADPNLSGRFLKSVADTGVIDGKTYALPNNGMQPVVLYYNKQLFEQVGAQPPTTWDELMALVPKFKDAGIAPLSIGGQSKWPNLMWEEYLVDRIGGPEVFDAIAANEPNAWSDPAVLEANEKIQQLVDAGGFINGFSSIAADSGADLALLYTGKAAMLVQGSWNYPALKTANPQFIKDGKLGWTTFPAVAGGKGDPKNVAGNPANFWSISSKATDSEKKAALAYLGKGVMNDSYVDALLKGGSVPPVAGLEPKLAKTEDPEWLGFVYDLAQEAPHFQLSWDQALSPKQADALLTNLDQLFLGQISPQQFSDNMNKTIEQ
jgi:raffinose/stachyose/melibiose transport system substrate-binding protein